MRIHRQARHLFALGLLLVFAASAAAEVCPSSQVPKAERDQYDALVPISPAQEATALQTHLPFGAPPCPKLLPQGEYIVCYSPTHRVALWAAYRLKAEDVVDLPRRNAFRTDPRLTAEDSSHCADYAGTGYDRGHIVPRGDMNRSKAAQANTFFLSDMAPQTPALNRGMWRWLEDLVRSYAQRYGEVHIVVGSVIQEPRRVLPAGNVTIPSRFYKVVIRTNPDGTQDALAMVLPNLVKGLPVPPGTQGVAGERISAEEADTYLAAHTVSIREIGNLTGLDLLPNLDADALKRAVALELWPRN